jgi:hypothetical protein
LQVAVKYRSSRARRQLRGWRDVSTRLKNTMSRLEQLGTDEPLDLVALGELKGVSRNTLLCLVKAGRIEYTNVDGQVRVKPSEFDRYVGSYGSQR